jgi:hypothetical protein
MLYQELEKIAPQLAGFLSQVSPQLSEEDVEIYKGTSIPKGIEGRGKCYLFSYRNPVGKGTPKLPYYHTFPMVISLEQKQKHFFGINPFYLGPTMRKTLVDGFLNSLSGDPENMDTRCLISYKIVNTYKSSLHTVFPCLKNYVHTRMSPIVLQIKPSLWREMYLGAYSKMHQNMFVGNSSRSVWARSRIQALNERRKQ